MPVRERNVAMVYQQFINYPSMTVADNIASPLQAARRSRASTRGCSELAAKLHIEPFLKRLPAELSGGQQQRVALARALAKKRAADAARRAAGQPRLQAARGTARGAARSCSPTGESTVVYATTEPTEALLLGGYTAVLDAGELLQYGPTAEVFHAPAVDARGARLQRPADEPARRPAPPRTASRCRARPDAAAARCRPSRQPAR